MKVAIPTDNQGDLGDKVSFHFGRVKNYIIYDTENKKFEVLANTSEHMGGKGLPPELLHQAGVDVMLCSSLGHRALEIFNNFGIEVYCGVQGTVEQAIKNYQDGKLDKANKNNICQH